MVAKVPPAYPKHSIWGCPTVLRDDYQTPKIGKSAAGLFPSIDVTVITLPTTRTADLPNLTFSISKTRDLSLAPTRHWHHTGTPDSVTRIL
jgi:hypothetical protein